MLMYIALLCLCHITPFGEKTWIMYDLKRQYVDFYSYYKTIVSGESNIFYSFSTALGSGILGFFIYYLSNPLFLIFCLFRAEQFPLAVSIMIGITLVLAAIIMDLFLQWYLGTYADPDGSRCWIWIFSIAWSFSGFLIAHSMNMMWTDVVILLPLILYFLEIMLREKRIAIGYILVLAVMLILNYYITYQVLIFLGLWTLMRLWLTRSDKPFKEMTRVAFATVISVAMDAVLLLPAAFELANSPKDITRLGLEASGKNISPLDVFSKAFLFCYDANQPRFGLPQIYVGILLLLLFISFFTLKEIDKRERIAFGILFLFLIASFCIDYMNLFWHAGMEPSGHPYRQAPVCVFTMLLCSARAFAAMHHSESGIKTKSILFSMVVLVGIWMMLARSEYEYVNKKMLITNLLMIVLYAVLLCLNSKKNIKKSKLDTFYLILLTTVLAAELLANAVFTYPYIAQKCENSSEYADKITANRSVVGEIKMEDPSFYRMESLTPRQQNEAMMYNFKGVTHYSSAGMTYVRYFLQKCGYNDDTLYTHYGHDNTVAMDSILGIKYLVTEDTSVVHPSYIQQSTPDGGVFSYVNPYFAGVAFATDTFADCKTKWENFEDIMSIGSPKEIMANPFDLQEDLVSRLVGEQTVIFKPADTMENYLDEHTIEYIVTPSIDGELYMYIDGLDELSQGMAIYRGDEFLTSYGNASCYKVLNLGYSAKDHPITIQVYVENDEPIFGEALFRSEDLSVIEEASEQLSHTGFDIKQISSSHLEMSVPEAKGIWTSIPYEEGWNISLNGKGVDPICIYGALMYIPTGEAGKLEMVFVPVGFKAGAMISIIAILGLCISIRWKKHCDIHSEFPENKEV